MRPPSGGSRPRVPTGRAHGTDRQTKSAPVSQGSKRRGGSPPPPPPSGGLDTPAQARGTTTRRSSGKEIARCIPLHPVSMTLARRLIIGKVRRSRHLSRSRRDGNLVDDGDPIRTPVGFDINVRVIVVVIDLGESIARRRVAESILHCY